MKRLFITGSIILIFNTLFAQEYNQSVNKNSDNSNVKFGQLITVLPFGAKLYKNCFANAQDLFDNIKKTCWGKNLFVDFWATWCSPCLEEWPNIKKLYLGESNLQIEFIYICTDYASDMKDWISTISRFKQPGIHLFVENNIINDMFRLFPIAPSFPCYAFIDKNGKFRPEAFQRDTPPDFEKLKQLIK